MTRLPLVSIIINNFNYGRFLKEAIDSALGQTYPNLEVIVVDDGSSDNSREVIRDYGTKIVPVFKANGGQGSAYNAGFAVSRGAIICNLDADDILYPSAMAQAVAAFDAPDVVKVQWPLAVTDAVGNATGEITAKRKPPEGNLWQRVLEEGPLYDFHFTTGCALARTFLEQVFPMPEAPYRNGGDVYLITLAPVYGQLRMIRTVLGTYRAHGENNYQGKPLAEQRILNYIKRFEVNSSCLSEHLKRLGFDPDIAAWKERNFIYLWLQKFLAAKQDMASVVPAGRSFIFVDDTDCGVGEPIPERRAVPFLERDGVYWGPPSDDTTAVGELERLRTAGAEFIAFWWNSFWWFDHYVTFNRYLLNQYPLVIKNDRVVVFDLRRGQQSRKAA